MQMKIYTLTHKKFSKPDDELYVPLQVGTALNQPLGYLEDNTGDNISHLNGYYSELTGLYWIWKNVHNLDYVGTCHYRRYLIDDKENIMNEQQYLEIFRDYDLVTTKRVILNNSYHYGFAANHNVAALDMTGEVIKEIYPEYYDTFIKLVNENETYFGNMFVTTKTYFDRYAEWLFNIFFEVQKRIDMETDKDAYHRRVFGFISEFLLLVWVKVNALRVKECKVGMIGEKAETRELKEVLSRFLEKNDIKGAKEYFMDYYKKRPDVLMEASDVTGELHIILQIIATADAQLKRTGTSFYNSKNNIREWIDIFVNLNNDMKMFLEDHLENGWERKYILYGLTDDAFEISKLLISSVLKNCK